MTQTRQRYAARGGPLRGYGGPLRGYGGRAATRHLVAAAPKPRRGLDETSVAAASGGCACMGTFYYMNLYMNQKHVVPGVCVTGVCTGVC